MPQDMLDFPDDAPVDKVALQEMKRELRQLPGAIMGNKIEQISVLKDAAKESGLTGVGDALTWMMQDLKVGIRRMAEVTGVKRKVLQGMIDGSVEMDPDVFNKMYAHLKEQAKRQKRNLDFL